MALADSPSYAAAVPVTLVSRSTLFVAAATALGSRFGEGAQRSVLPFGLKAGHHPVREETNRWTPQDTGRYPVVIIAAGGPAALGEPLPAYLASHGFTVARALRTTAETVAREFDDSTTVAILTWESDSGAAAAVELPGGIATTRLSIRVVRRGDPRSQRLRVVLPARGIRPGAESRGYRLLCAVTQAILNATLEAAHPSLSELADRLKAAGVREAYIRAP